MDGLIIGVVLVIILFVAFLIEKKPWGWKGYEIIASWRERGLQGISAFWAQVPFLKITYIFVAGIIGLHLIELFFNLLDSVAGIPTDETITPSEVRNLAIAFLGTITGLGALFGVYLAIRRTEESKRQSDASERDATTAEQGLITDQLNKATEGLGKSDKDGKPVIEVRLGGLYALERIAKSSIDDHIQIMEILCAYIRNNSPKGDDIRKSKKLTEDIQTAITIIGRREKWTDGNKWIKRERSQKYTLKLDNCNLREAYLPMANMSQAELVNANFNDARLSYANLSESWIGFSNLSGAMLKGTNMKNAKTDQAYAYECDFSECKNLTQKQLNNMYCGVHVKIPKGLIRPKHWATDDLSWDDFTKAYEKYCDKILNRIMRTPKD